MRTSRQGMCVEAEVTIGEDTLQPWEVFVRCAVAAR